MSSSSSPLSRTPPAPSRDRRHARDAGGAADRLFNPGFVVLRTPLLPLGIVTDLLGDGDTGAEGDAIRRARVEARLREIVAWPAVREALEVASPSLMAALSAWEADPTCERAAGVTQTLLRYLGRMAARPTPFGLFASSSLVPVGEESSLHMGGFAACRRHVRLDMEYVTSLVAALEQIPEVRAGLLFRPNNALHVRPSVIHVPLARERASGAATFSLVAVEASDAVREVLEVAAAGVTLPALAAKLVASWDVPVDEATSFVEEVVGQQLLVSELGPPLTGPDPLDHVIGVLSRVALELPVVAVLREVKAELARLGALSPGVGVEGYEAIVRLLEGLPVQGSRDRLFQVDLFRDGDGLTLGREVVDEVARAVALVRSIGASTEFPSLAAFRAAFEERYGDREVPLEEALDDELGVGFPSGDSTDASHDEAPLLDGLRLAHPAGPRRVQVDPYLLCRLLDASASGTWELTDHDVEVLRAPNAQTRHPRSFHAMCRLLSSGSGDARGPVLELVTSSGVSSANALARFCHGDAAIADAVRALTAREAEGHEGTILAEVVHLPHGRLGNISLRPVLRDYEIAYLAASGAPADRRLDVSDLLVSVDGGVIRLRSKRLGRWIEPRITNAHDFTRGQLPVYRFLGALQTQGVSETAHFQWGELSSLPSLPRVTRGRVVLRRAQWNVPAVALEPVIRAPREERRGALARLRGERRIPRFVLVASYDRQFLIDLENPASADAFTAWADREVRKGASTVTLVESIEDDETSAVRSDLGGHTCEILIPFFETGEPLAAPHPRPVRPVDPREDWERRPGDDWLYLKLYGGTAAADAALVEVVAPAARSLVEEGLADQWFFLRYTDPKPHLRVRLHGAPGTLLAVALGRFMEALRVCDAAGRISRVQLDTYVREVRRYGGVAATALSERIFWADSEAVADIVQHPELGAASARWQAVVVGVHRLLVDLGCTFEERRALIASLAEGFRGEYARDPLDDRAMGARFRAARGGLLALFKGETGVARDLHAILDRRSRAVRSVVRELRAIPPSELRTPLLGARGIFASYVHMFATRAFPSENRRQETVVHELLRRHYDGEAARAHERGPSSPSAAPESMRNVARLSGLRGD